MHSDSVFPSTSSIVRKSRPGILLDGVNRDDARMVERGDGTRFALESRAAVGVACGLVSEDLQRHLASELRVLGQVDLAHAARAQRAQDTVMRDVLSW